MIIYEATPVPIPNTEVKLICADNTWGSPPGKIGCRQFLYSSIAQLVERSAVNRQVTGSSPVWGAKAVVNEPINSSQEDLSFAPN